MLVEVRYCDLCRLDSIRKMAVGKYQSDETFKWWDACAQHLKDVNGYGMKSRLYKNAGDVDWDRFYDG